MHLSANKIIYNFLRSFRTRRIFEKDRNRPGLHRSELKSCNFLQVEQTFFFYYCVN